MKGAWVVKMLSKNTCEGVHLEVACKPANLLKMNYFTHIFQDFSDPPCPPCPPMGKPDFLFFPFFTFFKFSFFGLLGGWSGGQKCQKKPNMKNDNCIRHALYLRNIIAYGHDFWYTCVKWWYLQAFFPLI